MGITSQQAAQYLANLSGKPVPMEAIKPAPKSDFEKLNKLERSFLMYLERTGALNIGIQNITLKLGQDCRYTPDLSSIDDKGLLTFWECKGQMRDDALVKIKTAARQFPRFKFVLVRWNKGNWDMGTISQ